MRYNFLNATYRFLISSRAKWSNPTDRVLITFRFGPGIKDTNIDASTLDQRTVNTVLIRTEIVSGSIDYLINRKSIRLVSLLHITVNYSVHTKQSPSLEVFWFFVLQY